MQKGIITKINKDWKQKREYFDTLKEITSLFMGG